jgi:acyl carrier protein
METETMCSSTSSSLTSRVYGIVADVLDIPVANIGPESSPETIESWDSVNHLNLVLALEQEFQVQLEPEEIDQVNSVKQILAVLTRKLSSQT